MSNASSGNNWQEGLSTLNQQIPASAPIPGGHAPGESTPQAATTAPTSAMSAPAATAPQTQAYPMPSVPENPAVTVVDLAPPTVRPAKPIELTNFENDLSAATTPQPAASHTSTIVGIIIFIVIAGIIGVGAYFLFRVPPG